MSYCRFSSDDWQCDVYVYANTYGSWTCHVAGRRRIFDDTYPREFRFPDLAPGSPGFDLAWAAFVVNRNACLRWMDAHEDGPWLDLADVSEFAGEHYNESSPLAMAKRLTKLKESGLNVPDYAIEDLLEEWEEMKLEPS